MAKPYRRIIHGLQRLCANEIPSKSLPPNPISYTHYRLLHSRLLSPPRPPHLWNGPSSTPIPPKPSSLNRIFHNPPTPNLNPSRFSNQMHPSFGNPSKLPSFSSKIVPVRGLGGSGLRCRYFSVKNLGKLDGSLRKSVVEKPLSSVKSTVSRYREAVGLQAEAFWKRNYLILAGAGGVVLCIALWRVMFGIANTFVGLSEGMAKYGFLALASAMVAFAGMYIRSRFTINPDKIYRIAMRKLNTSAAILEVMGAPLTGTEVRAYVMSGGGPKLKNFKFRIGGKRCFLIFPIRGSERRGLVSVEVKKKKGKYDMRLLAVDIPMTAGPDQRIFLIGDEQEYKVGGGLISELRDPIVKAMAAEKEFDDLDQKEEEDEEREREEAERKHQEEEERAVEEAERRRREHEKLEIGNS